MPRKSTGDGSGMAPQELLGLPLAVDLTTAGRAFTLGRTKAYALAKAGEFPVPVLRIGNSYRVRRADLLDALGITDQPEPVAA
ncbi:MerR family transcriptional regulator [Nocardiopsis kunsanensis]|uniref:hypothetical protein n=1 Tax=Nocardiopsis kunsanensis TaxID=141693 RepID=UPI0005953DB0|nr:hypothetical protein [Nocardiopsis kunsanensis]